MVTDEALAARRAKHAAYKREWRRRNPDKVRASLQRNAARRAAYGKQWKQKRAFDPAYRAAQAAKRREYMERNPDYRVRQRALVKARGTTRTPEADRARQSVKHALKVGKLIRPDICEQCGTECKPEAAHHNYEQRLRVRWLCRMCHRKWDHDEPKGGYVPVQRPEAVTYGF